MISMKYVNAMQVLLALVDRLKFLLKSL